MARRTGRNINNKKINKMFYEIKIKAFRTVADKKGKAIISAAKSEIKEIRRTMPQNKCAVRCSSCAFLDRSKHHGLTDFQCKAHARSFPFPTQKACSNHKPIVEANDSSN